VFRKYYGQTQLFVFDIIIMPKVLQRHFFENLIEERENFTSPESKCCLIVSHLLFPPVSLYQTIINRGADSILVTKPDCNVIVLCAQSLCCFHCKSVGLIQNYFCSQLQSVRYILLLNSNLFLSLMWLKTLRWSWSKVLLLTFVISLCTTISTFPDHLRKVPYGHKRKKII